MKFELASMWDNFHPTVTYDEWILVPHKQTWDTVSISFNFNDINIAVYVYILYEINEINI